MLKFPADGGIVTICSTILIPAECTTVITSPKEIPNVAGTSHQNLKVAIHPNFPDQKVAIGGTLSLAGRTELCTLLKKNMDIFTWQPSDMTGVPRSIAEHRLNIREGYSLVRQKKSGQASERAKAIQAEVQKLVAARIKREVYYHNWLSNPVMVKKYDGSWRMCVDFTDLNMHDPAGIVTLILELTRKIESSLGKVLAAIQNLEEMHKKSDFRWTPEAEQAFKQLKQHLSELPLLVAPKPKEELIVYLSASYGAVSAVLMTERGTVQTPVYFISRALQGPELNYTPMEKLVLSLVFAAKRLRRYFQAHPIAVITDQPIKQIMSRPDVAGRLQKWSVMLGEHNITYRLRASVKGQILTDFLFTASNNGAEYEALIAGLCIAAQMGIENVQVNVDSKLVASQVLGDEASKLRIKARQYELMKGTLYRRSFLKAWLRCLGPLQASYVICEIHEGSCSMHAGPRSVVAKAMQLDIIGQLCTGTPFPEGPDKVKFLIVAMDYFTKWMEVKSVATITGNQTYGKGKLKSGEGIKARLGKGNKNWLEKLPRVLWAHRTMNNSSHGDTPFSLTYGTEAVIPAEIGMPTYRTMTVDTVHNDEELRLNLDLLEEKRERAAICEAKSKMKMAKYYNDRVYGFAFRPGDFVYATMTDKSKPRQRKTRTKVGRPISHGSARRWKQYKIWNKRGGGKGKGRKLRNDTDRPARQVKSVPEKCYPPPSEGPAALGMACDESSCCLRGPNKRNRMYIFSFF
ncbi:reverse transcriptase domain-containing protein [Tanacetum coccineum]|uniref:Reverse transcriptase domain-containing protein n=1 Tax=Tanacetum coccineum TaxID=301880 RepID=A0ABQ4ZW68_9ASTR